MKKPKTSMELDDLDLDLDSSDELNIDDLDIGSGANDEDIIELTDMVIDGMDEGPFDPDDFEFDLEALEKQSEGVTGDPAKDHATGQETLPDEEDVQEEDLFPHLKGSGFDDETVVSLEESFREASESEGAADSSEETIMDQTILDQARAPSERRGATVSEEGMLHDGSSVGGEPLQEMEALIDDVVEQIETRLLGAVEQVVESRLPDLVRSILREEIDRLKKEIQE